MSILCECSVTKRHFVVLNSLNLILRAICDDMKFFDAFACLRSNQNKLGLLKKMRTKECECDVVCVCECAVPCLGWKID